MNVNMSFCAKKLQIPPVRFDFDFCHASRPAHGIQSRQKHRKVTAHGAVHGGCFTVRLHQRRVERDVSRYSLQLRDGHAHHEGDRARAVDGDDRLGENTTGIFDKRTALRQRNGRDIFLVLDNEYRLSKFFNGAIYRLNSLGN